jgi:hypothetical protein
MEKEYRYQPEDEDIALITGILHEMICDPEERREIEGERAVLRIFNNVKNPLRQTIAKQAKALEEQAKALEEQAKAIEEKDKNIKEQAKKIAKLERLLRDKQVE